MQHEHEEQLFQSTHNICYLNMHYFKHDQWTLCIMSYGVNVLPDSSQQFIDRRLGPDKCGPSSGIDMNDI
jgi:hypothetical protein